MSEMCQYSKSRILSVILATEINSISLVCEEGAPVSWSTDEEMEAETYGTSSQKKIEKEARKFYLPGVSILAQSLL